jgi:two-component system, OmpR family, phosphate regulon sensor histidine kinase PhoR
VRDDDGAWGRPRGQAWGNEAQRAVLHAVAEDIAKRTHHKVVAIEALRSDGFLEFVAIAGDDVARDKMLGQASPLALDHIHALGQEMDGWRHIPSERLDDVTRAFLDEYGHKPDTPASGLPNGWDPDDQLVRLLENEDGELRGLLYLDEPHSGLRPTPGVVAAINAEAGVLFEAIVSIVERELYGEQVRMVTAARRAIDTVRPGLGVEELMAELSRALGEALDVATVDVVVAGSVVPGLEDDRHHMGEVMRRQWDRRGHVVVERERTWSMQEESVETPPSLTRLLDTYDLGSGLLVPIGAGEEYLGTLAMGRAADAPRWIASEINAATVVAADLARLLLEVRLGERERALNAELRGVSDYRRDMVLTLAHELRNPVSVLFTHLELLDGESPAGAARESLDALGRAARRIEDMVEDLMALASVSDPEAGTSTTEVDLSALVHECAEFLAPMAALSGVELRLAVVDDLVLTGDPAALQRMVTNLLANAVKYTDAGGRVSVDVARATAGGVDGVRLTCADTGIGIPADEVDKVFTPFFRSSSAEARTRPGTGLGLAIIERVVTGHHGTVRLTSDLGDGTTFTVWLPLTPPAEVD